MCSLLGDECEEDEREEDERQEDERQEDERDEARHEAAWRQKEEPDEEWRETIRVIGALAPRTGMSPSGAPTFWTAPGYGPV